MTVRKKIIFEGQEIGLSQTMQRLQRQSEQMSSKFLENYAKSAKSSKEFLKLLQEEYNANRNLIQLQSQDKRFKILEDYERKLQQVNAREEDHYNKLRQKGLRGDALQSEMDKASTGFQEQRLAAGTVRDSALEELKKSTEQQKQTNDILKQILTEDKNRWEQEFRENRKGVEAFLSQAEKGGLENLDPEDRAKYAFQKALVGEEKGEQQQKQSVLKDIIAAGVIRDLGSIITQIPSARDGLDLIPGFTRMLGAASGAGVGTLAGLFTLNPAGGAAVGAELGQRGGEFAGNAISRFLEERENLEASRYGLRAVTGLDVGEDFSLAQFGFTKTMALEVAKAMALQSGSSVNDIRNLIGTQTGFGIDQGTLMQSVRATRRTGGEFGDEMSNLLGTAREQGIDRVLFNELIQNQNQLINSMGQMTDRVDPRNTMALLMELNQLGGGESGFAIRDPRSMGFINTLQQGLTSPNDFGRAMNLSILRQQDPNASLLDMIEAEEQGLTGEKGRSLLRGTVEQYTNMFQDSDLAVLALRSRFPGIPIQTLKDLVAGKDVLGSMDTEQMTAQQDLQGEGNVSMRVQLRAAVTDAFATGPLEGIKEVESQFITYFKDVFNEAYKRFIEENKTEGDKKVDKNLKSGVYNFGTRGLVY